MRLFLPLKFLHDLVPTHPSRPLNHYAYFSSRKLNYLLYVNIILDFCLLVLFYSYMELLKKRSLALSKISLIMLLYLYLTLTSTGLSQISSLFHKLHKCWSNEHILILLSHIDPFPSLYSYGFFLFSSCAI